MDVHPVPPKLPWAFCVWVFALSVPFWLIGPIAESRLRLDIPVNLPISALQAVTPILAASILVYRQQGAHGVKELLRRAVDVTRIKNKLWYLPIFGLMPLIYGLAYVLMTLSGAPLPDDPRLPLGVAPLFFVAFFIAAVCEEVGWSGYALDRFQDRWTAWNAALLLGCVWALLHIIPDLQAHHTLTWITGQRLSTILLRILLVWLYNNTGRSVFTAVIFHAMDNVSVFLFPNYGSHHDPFYSWLILMPTTAAAIYLWGTATLARYRFARTNR